MFLAKQKIILFSSLTNFKILYPDKIFTLPLIPLSNVCESDFFCDEGQIELHRLCILQFTIALGTLTDKKPDCLAALSMILESLFPDKRVE